LTPDIVELFISIERPGGKLARAYERCLATLKQRRFPPHLYEIAARIDDDGIGHFQHFRNIQRILADYAEQDGDYPYLRNVSVTRCPETEQVLELFNELLEYIASAYALEAEGKAVVAEAQIQRARAKMLALQTAAEAAASKGLGVPFLGGET
jgi:hypothetical protein